MGFAMNMMLNAAMSSTAAITCQPRGTNVPVIFIVYICF
jgi:hypothetical protein